MRQNTSSTRLVWLWCIFLVAVMVKMPWELAYGNKPPADKGRSSATEQASKVPITSLILLESSVSMLQLGMEMMTLILEQQIAHSKESATERQRIAHNASTLSRFCKAFQHYQVRIFQQFRQEQVFLNLGIRLMTIQRIMERLHKEATTGKIDALAIRTALQRLKQMPGGSIQKTSTAISATQQAFLLEAIYAFATGFEIMAYHQLKTLSIPVRTPNPSAAVLLATKEYLLILQQERQILKKLLAIFPQEKQNISWYVFHASSLLRCSSIMTKKAVAPQKQTFPSCMKTLGDSLRKANPDTIDAFQ